MASKQRPIALKIMILLLILVVTGILLFYFKKPPGISKSLSSREQTGQSQTSQSAQGSAPNEASSPIPLISNLPRGVAASSIGPVEGKSGNAKVIAVSNGKTFSLILEAQLADPSNNQFYEAWLAKNSNDDNLLKLGKLQKSDNSYSISFNQDGDFSEYKIAVVTLETIEDDRSETKILEGSF